MSIFKKKQMIDTVDEYESSEEAEERLPLLKRLPGSPVMSVLFFPLAFLFHELTLQIFESGTPFTANLLLYILVFGLAAGFLVSFLMSLIRNPRAYTIVGSILIFLWTTLTCIEFCCKHYFATYYSLSFSAAMMGNILGDFFVTMLEVIASNIPFILLSLIPLVVFIVFRRQLFPPRLNIKWRMLLLTGLIACQLIGVMMVDEDADKHYYTYDFTADTFIPHFGLVSELRLEIQYAIFGIPEAPIAEIPDIIIDEPEPVADPEPEEIVYGYNVMDSLDLTALMESSNGNIAKLSEYFNSITPSQQNEYTGMFEGKNLILITAEAFSGYVIDKDLTPTLYRLSTKGFVFNNFYQPGWGQSTTGGEFAVMTGIIPTWVNGNTSFYASSKDTMTFGLGNVFSKLGYSVPAWHNNSWTYYNRDKTHPNLGYDYKGTGNGLSLPSDSGGWPSSDLEMIQATCDNYIQNYVNDGTNFHAYYMTVSGHANYGWGHAMSKKNKEVAKAAYPDASSTVQAYVAAQLELEYALEYLVNALEEAGIADETVICLCADHYPYAMASGDVDYYRELSGINDSESYSTRFRNTWILWCGSMEESDPVVIDDPCMSVDIVPTLLNLFGIEYDSRIFSGRDILATNYDASKASTCMPLAILPTGYGYSWHTAAGLYEAKTGTFTPNEGITVDENYVSTVNAIVKAKMSYANLTIKSDFFGVAFGEE